MARYLIGYVKSKWALPLLGLVFFCLLAGLVHVGAGIVSAQSAPPRMEPGELIDALQARADAVGGLKGVLGFQVTVPTTGEWEGMAFEFRAPDSFAQLRGWRTDTAEAAPVQRENAWHLRTAEAEYRRVDGLTYRLEPGRPCEGLPYDDGPETLLLVNLMPAAWFEPAMDDLQTTQPELVGGTYYHVIRDVEQPPAPSSIICQYPGLLDLELRRARQYYVNAETLVCERIVLGHRDREKVGDGGLDSPVGDIVAGELEPAGGGRLPASYTRRSFGAAGVYQAVKMTLHGVESAGPGAFGSGDFTARGRTPGPNPVVFDPREGLKELERRVEARGEAGDYLSLANAYRILNHPDRGLAVLGEADELFAGEVSADYSFKRDELHLELEKQQVKKRLVEAPQLVRIYSERAERFRKLGDEVHAAHMEGKADRYSQRLEAARARAQELGLK